MLQLFYQSSLFVQWEPVKNFFCFVCLVFFCFFFFFFFFWGGGGGWEGYDCLMRGMWIRHTELTRQNGVSYGLK